MNPDGGLFVVVVAALVFALSFGSAWLGRRYGLAVAAVFAGAMVIALVVAVRRARR